MAKIVTVYESNMKRFEVIDASYLRWLKISEALGRAGHRVDMATNEPGFWHQQFAVPMGKNLRRVPLKKVKWGRYDVVKTVFRKGLDTLIKFGGEKHPFIVSKLGSVARHVDSDDVYFSGEMREKIYDSMVKVNEISKYVTILSQVSIDLWKSYFGEKTPALLVPGAVDAVIPPKGPDPYKFGGKKRCLFSGNLYDKWSQPKANRTFIRKLNSLGKYLREHDYKLYVMGRGDIEGIDPYHVIYVGEVPYKKSWDYFHHADVGIVLALGKHPNQNESTKIYHYLRAGLPTVCERGFPNENIILDANLGFVTENDNMELMAARIIEAAERKWDKQAAVDYILKNHTWDARVKIYSQVIAKELGK